MRLLNDADDLRQRGFTAYLGRLYAQHTMFVDRRTDDRVAFLLLHRDALPSQHRFIYGRDAANDNAIDRDLLTWLDDQYVSRYNRFDRHHCFDAVFENQRRFGLQSHQRFDRLGGAAFG